MTHSHQVILVDWGTTNFRAWLVASNSAEVLDEISDGLGMSSLAASQFPAYCRSRLRDWRKDTLPPVYMAGMVGAAQGWVLAPQLPVPLGLDELARQVISAPGFENAWIIPGARVSGSQPDVMRGEEVQIFGALEQLKQNNALLCLPGTHSKWAQVVDGKLAHFTTNMTGELYEILLKHSILGNLSHNGDGRSQGFTMGLKQSSMQGELLYHLFTARSRVLCGDLSSDDVAAYLSGLLIGYEVNAMQALYPTKDKELILVCADHLHNSYKTALSHYGYKTRWLDARVASIYGMQAIVGRHCRAY